MLLVMSLSWVEMTPSQKSDGLQSLYVHKAVTFEAGGRTYLDVFTPPRRATYVANYFTATLTQGRRDDGSALDGTLDCPTLYSNAFLEKMGSFAARSTGGGQFHTFVGIGIGNLWGSPILSQLVFLFNVCLLAGDRLWGRILVGKAGVGCPETLAFVLRPFRRYDTTDAQGVVAVERDTREELEEQLRTNIQQFIERIAKRGHSKVMFREMSTPLRF